MQRPPAAAPPIDVPAFMAGLRFGPVHLRVLSLCALVGLLDGADSQSIGVAAPALAGAIGVKLANFGLIFSAAQFGAMLGAFASGPLADRYGRRPMLVANTILFGLFTLATPLGGTFTELFWLRFGAGLGLGGATPCFLALISDYAPARRRAALASLLWASFPIGATLGALLNAYLIAHRDWRVIFYVDGTAPLCIALLLLVALPESPQVLVRRDPGSARLRRLMARLMSGGLDAGGATFMQGEDAGYRASPAELFVGGLAYYTPLLWALFALAFSTLTVFVLWAPALLHTAGLGVAEGAAIVAWSNLGAMTGQGSAGRLVERFGPRWTLAPALILGAFCFACVGLPGAPRWLVALAAAGEGLFVGVGSSGAIALAALAYPAHIRSTGIGWGMALGRGGQVIGPLIAGAVLASGASSATVFSVMSAPALLAAGVAVLLSMRRKREHNDPLR